MRRQQLIVAHIVLLGETITAAGLVIKDKYIASVSGGEFGVHCHVTAYNINLAPGTPRSANETING